MNNFIYNIWSKFLVWFSKIKILSFYYLPVLACDLEGDYVNGYDIVRIMQLVKPGDVLIRGYDEYLDGKFIPDELGYSHAGLYIGDNQIIHACAPCVQYGSLVDFCQCDRIMILRPTYGTIEAIELAKSKVGVPYDFNYESDRGKLYCFELIATVYHFVDFETFTISKFFGLVKRTCYIAKSLYGSEFFLKVYEKNKNAES